MGDGRPITPEQRAVGERVKALRERLGLTQEKLAARSGGLIDRIAVLRMEGGHHKIQSDRSRVGLSKAFGLSLDDLHGLLHGELTTELAIQRSKRQPRQAS